MIEDNATAYEAAEKQLVDQHAKRINIAAMRLIEPFLDRQLIVAERVCREQGKIAAADRLKALIEKIKTHGKVD